MSKIAKFILTAQLRLAAPTNVAAIVSQINRGLRGVHVNVTINTHGINGQLNNINRSLNASSRAAKSASNDIERFGEQAALAIRRYGAFTLATTAFIKLTHAIQSGINDAIKFDREMVRIAQVTGHSLSGLKELNQEVTRLSKTYGVASSEILEAGVTLAQAGQSAKQVKTILESIAKTGVSATFGNMKNTTEAVIAAMQQFNLKAEDMEKTLSSINAVSAKFAVESSDITTAIVRTGGAFEAAGGKIEEFQALFTSVRQTTRESAETIATGFRTIFTRLQRSRTQNFLQSLGIDLKDVEGQFVGPYEAVRRLSAALKDLRSTDPRFAQIIEELGGFRQISKVIPLVTKFDVAQQALNVSLRSGNSLTEDAEVAQQSLAIQLSKVREEFLALIRNVANNTAFKQILDLTLKLTSSLISLADALSPILPLMAAVGAVKIGSGLGSFARGFGNKISGHADGGYVRGFATGGLVPGHGSGDTVPARLTPGEFVVRKNAVKAIGAHNLEKVNKFAYGGIVLNQSATSTNDKYTLTDIDEKGIKNKYHITTKQAIKALGLVSSLQGTAAEAAIQEAVAANKIPHAKSYATLLKNASPIYQPDGKVDTGIKQEKAKQLGSVPKELKNGETRRFIDIGDTVSIVTPDSNFNGKSQPITVDGTLAQIGKATSSTAEGSQKVYEAFAAKYGISNIEDAKKAHVKAHSRVFGLKKDLAKSFHEHAEGGIKQAILNVINSDKAFKTIKDKAPASTVDLSDVISTSAKNTLKGVVFEGVIRHAIGSKIEQSGSDAVIDFKDTKGFDKVFENGANVGEAAEAKYTVNAKNARSTVLKTLKDRYGVNNKPEPTHDKNGQKLIPFQRLAVGGHAKGTDTVPAMLTPGEFVINKSAASKLGSTTLHKLNNADKVQHFATGGAVGSQHFATGGTVGSTLANPLAISLIATSLSQFVKQFSNGNKVVDKFLDSITGVAFQFGIFQTLINTTNDSLKLHRIPFISADSRSLENIKSDHAEKSKASLDATLASIDSSRITTRINRRGNVVPLSSTRQQLEDERINKIKKAAIADDDIATTLSSRAKFRTFGNRAARLSAGGGALLGSIGSIAGQHFSEQGSKNIAEGKDGSRNSAIGGALSGGAAGAAIGAAFGPFGLVIGGATGAIIGWTSALNAAKKELDEVKFAQKIEKFSAIIDRVASGKLSVIDAQADIISHTKETVSRFTNSTGDDKKNVKASFATDSGKLEQIIIDMAKSAESFDALEASTGKLISDFTLLTSLPYKSFKDQLTKQITAQKKSTDFLNKADKLHDAEVRAAIGLSAMTEAIHTTAASFGDFDSKMANTIKFLDGGLASSSTKDASSIFESAGKGQIRDTTELDKVVSGITSSFGDLGKEQGSKVSENAQLLSALPSLLLEAKGKTGFGAEQGTFEAVLRKILEGQKNDDGSAKFSTSSINQVTGGVRNVIGHEGKDEKIIDAIRNNLDQVVGEVGKPLQSTIAELKEFAPAFKEQGERIRIASEAYAQAQLKSVEIQLRIIKKEEDFENLVAHTRNKVRGNTAIRNEQLNRVKFLSGGSTDPQVIAAQIKTAQEQASHFASKASSTTKVDDIKQFNLLKDAENVKIAKANKALAELADTSEVLSEIQKELSEVEERRKEKNGILDTAIFGSRADKLQQSRALALTAHAQRFGIDSIAEEHRGTVKSTLESRGKFGQEELKRLKENSRFGHLIGQDNTKEISTEGDNPAANKLLEAAKEYIDGAKKAETAILGINNKLAETLKTNISTQNQEFLDKLETIFKNNLISNVTNAIASTQSEHDETRDKIDIRDRIHGNFGVNDKTMESLNGAIGLGKQRIGIKRELYDLEQSGIQNLRGFDGGGKIGDDLVTHAAEIAHKDYNLGDISKNIKDKVNAVPVLIPTGADRTGVVRYKPRNMDDIKKDQAEAAQKAIKEEINNRIKAKNTELKTNTSELDKNKAGQNTKTFVDSRSLDDAEKGFVTLGKELQYIGHQTLPELDARLKSLVATLDVLHGNRKKIKDSIPIKKATGGHIPGIGNTDTVPAMLTPGEFVMKKSAVESIGIENLYAMNNGYNKGGVVQGFAEGGQAFQYSPYTAANLAHYQKISKSKSAHQDNMARGGYTESELKAQQEAEAFGGQIYRANQIIGGIRQSNAAIAAQRKKDAPKHAAITESITRFQKRLAEKEAYSAARNAVRMKQAQANANVYNSMGDSEVLRAQKKALYEKGMSIGVKSGKPKVTRGRLLEEQERMERATALRGGQSFNNAVKSNRQAKYIQDNSSNEEAKQQWEEKRKGNPKLVSYDEKVRIESENATDTQMQHRLRKAASDKSRAESFAVLRAKALKAKPVRDISENATDTQMQHRLRKAAIEKSRAESKEVKRIRASAYNSLNGGNSGFQSIDEAVEAEKTLRERGTHFTNTNRHLLENNQLHDDLIRANELKETIDNARKHEVTTSKPYDKQIGEKNRAALADLRLRDRRAKVEGTLKPDTTPEVRHMAYAKAGMMHSEVYGNYVLNSRANRNTELKYQKEQMKKNAKNGSMGNGIGMSGRGTGLGFNKGGVVRHYAGGGHVSGGTDIKGVEELRGVVEKFSTVVNGLAEKLSQFKDMSISLQATHKVDVTFNGAEIFSKLSPEIQRMAVEETKKAINNMLDSKFPDVGRIK